jgi:type VI secretion system secreted protein Hcp
LLVVAATVAPAANMYLQVAGVPGESVAAAHKGEIELLKFSFGVNTQIATSGGGGGAMAGKPMAQPLKVLKRVDASSVGLFMTCATGKHLPQVRLSVARAGAGDFLIIVLSDVMVTSCATTGEAAEPVPTEEIAFHYSKITWEYKPQLATGQAGTPLTGGWDFAANRAVGPTSGFTLPGGLRLEDLIRTN